MSLTKWLNDAGIPTRQGGTEWRRVTVHTILKNPVYKGEALIGKTEVITDESRREKGYRMSYYLRDRDAEECIRIPVPAIVATDVWDMVQQRLADNRARMSGRKTIRFVLSGLWRCPECGHRGKVSHRLRKHYYYNCRSSSCPSCTYAGQVAERAVIEILRTFLRYPESIETAIRTFTQNPADKDAANTRERLLKDLTKLGEREKAAVTAQIAGIQAGADPAVYESVFAEISAKRKDLQAQIAALEVHEEPAIDPKDSAAVFTEAIADIEVALMDEFVEPHEKNALLSSVVQGVYPLNREGDYRVDLLPLPGSGLTVHQKLSWCQGTISPCKAGLKRAWS